MTLGLCCSAGDLFPAVTRLSHIGRHPGPCHCLMSRRRKHVRNLVDEALPELTQGDEVCVVTELRGGNQVEVRACD